MVLKKVTENDSFSDTPVHHFANPRAERGEWPSRLNTVIGDDEFLDAKQEISSWPGYRETPLHAMAPLARLTGVDAVLYKDEAQRFGLGSFKALGGAYAVLRLLMRETGLTADQVKSREFDERTREVTVVTATDGNHGRSVSWGARQFGCGCRIYIHAEVSAYRENAMRSLGADVVRVEGNYDESVRRAASDASENGWFVVSDTSWEGYTELPRYVMAGYGVMVDELIDQLEPGVVPTHVFVQGGVGGLAAAVAARFWMRYGDERPTFVVVEPARADCLYRSACNAAPVAVDITEETIMAGLSCGEVSQLAWEVLDTAADHFMTITDDNVAVAMNDLASGHYGNRSLVAGESAVAGLCGFRQAARDATLSSVIGLDSSSVVLLLGTEGATDPDIFRAMTGRSASGGDWLE
jgi:diaminopropionate ammonia-lyase